MKRVGLWLNMIKLSLEGLKILKITKFIKIELDTIKIVKLVTTF